MKPPRPSNVVAPVRADTPVRYLRGVGPHLAEKLGASRHSQRRRFAVPSAAALRGPHPRHAHRRAVHGVPAAWKASGTRPRCHPRPAHAAHPYQRRQRRAHLAVLPFQSVTAQVCWRVARGCAATAKYVTGYDTGDGASGVSRLEGRLAGGGRKPRSRPSILLRKASLQLKLRALTTQALADARIAMLDCDRNYYRRNRWIMPACRR